MVRSVDVLLRRHFGQSLAAPGVHVLDPFVGTGNFLVRVMDQIPAPDLAAKYGASGARGELHANEVMLLPYYVASLNIEHAYLDKTGSYRPFEGIVLVDTFEMVEGKTIGMFSAENSERAQRQREAPITVVIGNPPYNAHQVNANDANQNRQYPHVDGRVRETYAASSAATLKNKLYDPYVKAFRWASDRIGDQGAVAFVTNDSFLDDLSFDGMRRHLAGEFDEVWVLNLGGNVRKDPKLSGSTHNVFGIQVGVAVTLLVRTGGKRKAKDGRATIRYAEAGERWTKREKYDWLEASGDLSGLDWRELQPNTRHQWLTDDLADDWDDLMPLVSKAEKASDDDNETTILDEYSLGISTNRDAWVYDSDRQRLAERMDQFVDTYNSQVSKWERKGGSAIKPETVLTFDDTRIKWSRDLLKRQLMRGHYSDFDDGLIRRAMYRPFVARWLYHDDMFVDSGGLWRSFFPGVTAENQVICFSGKGSSKDFQVLMLDRLGSLDLLEKTQCVPLYVYRPLAEGASGAEGETDVELDGARYARRDNLTDWALGQFRERYHDEEPPFEALARWRWFGETPREDVRCPRDLLFDGDPGTDDPDYGRVIYKKDVFHYVYAVIHHPAYRARYAADLKRSLPRVPFAPAFWPLAEAGRALAALHVGYETAPEYPLALAHDERQPLTYRVEKMKLDPAAGTLRLNDSLTLAGIPEAAHRYRLGNRSALAWLVDQLRVKTDTRSGIVHDPNAAFAGDEIARLVRRVTTVSVETVAVVEALPDLGLPGD